MGKLNYKIKNIGRKYLKIIHKDQFLKVKTQIVSKIKVFFKMNTPKQTVYGREKRQHVRNPFILKKGKIIKKE